MVDAASLPQPEIALFNLIPIDPRERAPATYRLVTKVKNAKSCVLYLGDKRPLEVIDDAGIQDRLVNFDDMGSYTVRFAAFNGSQLVEKTKTIVVGANDLGDTMARLLVTYDAVKVVSRDRLWHLSSSWPVAAKESVLPFRKEHLAEQGVIVKAEFVNKDEPNPPRKLKLEIAPDKKSLLVTGEMTKPTRSLPCSALVKVELASQSPPQKIDRGAVTVAVTFNSPMTIPMQLLEPGWQIIRKQVSLQLWDGGRKAWEGGQAISNAPVTLRGQTCYVTVTPQSDSMLLRVDAAPVGPVIRPVSYPLRK